MESIENTVAQWAAEQGLHFEDDGYYFVGENGVKGHIKSGHKGKVIYLSTYLEQSAQLNSVSTLKVALKLNLFLDQTAGGFIAFDPLLNDLLYTATLSESQIDPLNLSNVLSNLLTKTLELREKFAATHHESSALNAPKLDNLHHLIRV